MVWSVTKSGEFELKATYEGIRKKWTPVSWHRLVWHSKNIPRHSFILWMGLSGALKTLNKLTQWEVVMRDDRVMCWSGEETENHLFHDCSYAREVWNRLWQQVY